MSDEDQFFDGDWEVNETGDSNVKEKEVKVVE